MDSLAAHQSREHGGDPHGDGDPIFLNYTEDDVRLEAAFVDVTGTANQESGQDHRVNPPIVKQRKGAEHHVIVAHVSFVDQTSRDLEIGVVGKNALWKPGCSTRVHNKGGARRVDINRWLIDRLSFHEGSHRSPSLDRFSINCYKLCRGDKLVTGARDGHRKVAVVKEDFRYGIVYHVNEFVSFVAEIGWHADGPAL